MSNQEPNYFGIIPAKIRYDNSLSSSQKLFFSEITALTQKTGYCWASNNYFADLYNVDRTTISKWVKGLKEKGYISVSYEKDGGQIKERRISPLIDSHGNNMSKGGGASDQQGGELTQQGWCINAKGNSTSINNTSKSVETPKAESDYPSSCEFLEEAKSIANHLLESIVEWDPDHKYSKNTPALKSWVVEIERAIRLDGRTKKQLDFVINYVYNGNSSTAQFWSGNIQSGKKLRKHFDKIKNQIKQERGSSPKQEWNKSRANTLKEYN